MRALNARHGYRPLYEEIVLRGPAELPIEPEKPHDDAGPAEP